MLCFIRLPLWTTKLTNRQKKLSLQFVEVFCVHLEKKSRYIHHYCQNTMFKNCELYTLAKVFFIFKEIKYI